MRDYALYLKDILAAIDSIEKFTDAFPKSNQRYRKF